MYRLNRRLKPLRNALFGNATNSSSSTYLIESLNTNTTPEHDEIQTIDYERLNSADVTTSSSMVCENEEVPVEEEEEEKEKQEEADGWKLNLNSPVSKAGIVVIASLITNWLKLELNEYVDISYFDTIVISVLLLLLFGYYVELPLDMELLKERVAIFVQKSKKVLSAGASLGFWNTILIILLVTTALAMYKQLIYMLIAFIILCFIHLDLPQVNIKENQPIKDNRNIPINDRMVNSLNLKVEELNYSFKSSRVEISNLTKQHLHFERQVHKNNLKLQKEFDEYKKVNNAIVKQLNTELIKIKSQEQDYNLVQTLKKDVKLILKMVLPQSTIQRIRRAQRRYQLVRDIAISGRDKVLGDWLRM